MKTKKYIKTTEVSKFGKVYTDYKSKQQCSAGIDSEFESIAEAVLDDLANEKAMEKVLTYDPKGQYLHIVYADNTQYTLEVFEIPEEVTFECKVPNTIGEGVEFENDIVAKYKIEFFYWGCSVCKTWSGVRRPEHRNFNLSDRYPDIDSLISRVKSYYKIPCQIVKPYWDTTDSGFETDEAVDLPLYVQLPSEFTKDNVDDCNDWLSDTYGFCIVGYKVM